MSKLINKNKIKKEEEREQVRKEAGMKTKMRRKGKNKGGKGRMSNPRAISDEPGF